MMKVFSGIALAASLWTQGSSAGVLAVETQPLPERVTPVTVPAQIAFTSNQQLWMLDGQDKNSKPVQVTKEGGSEIVGWSGDGNWLLFMKYPEGDSNYTKGYLWAVSKDGSTSLQIDERPIVEKPKWSPITNQFAYVAGAGSSTEPESETFFVTAQINEDNTVSVISTVKADFVDFAWMPDGKQFLVSLPVEKNRPMTLSLRDLAGKTVASYPIADLPNAGEEIYGWAAKGLQVSPDGKQVAYYVQYNSASLSADGVPVQLFDLNQPQKKPLELGIGLAYAEWMRWSPDSNQLAWIDGSDRMATQNKQVKVVDRQGKPVFEGGKGQVESFPVWTKESPHGLFFTRGLAKEYHYEPEKVMVPGQRIWMRGADGKTDQVTKGSDLTADTFPSPSADGEQLLFVRLDAAGHGSLYLEKEGEEVELIRHVSGNIGYYANYLPEWIEVYWDK